eukprot:TRINITY_DN5102_c0_g1_i1.p1 TRINITY_DN5102_c0_g1~~TRINITY_DN5102_c0_g1_i1.p1  ORF type:complete len:360 (+),score=68.68 TRINITY_DN5102_c0_g1_i1:92-1081(+)
MMKNHKYSFFLPLPIIGHIFGWLKVKDLARIETVCIDFFVLLRRVDHEENLNIWRKAYFNTFLPNTEWPDFKETCEPFEDVAIARADMEQSYGINMGSFERMVSGLKDLPTLEAMEVLKKVGSRATAMSDRLRVRNEMEEFQLPEFMINGTFFDPHSFHTFAMGNTVEENCTIKWVLFGLNGREIHFEFRYSCSGYSDECEPKASVKFKDTTGSTCDLFETVNQYGLPSSGTPLLSVKGIQQDSGTKMGAFENLGEDLGYPDLSPSDVMNYVTACSHLIERVYNGKVQRQYFFYELDSTKFCRYWPDFCYKPYLKRKVAESLEEEEGEE